jgi:hypothetical protein
MIDPQPGCPQQPGCRRAASGLMRNQIGFLMQFAALVFLPLLIIWQLNFGFPLIWMPALTVAGAVLFYVGHHLRQQAP